MSACEGNSITLFGSGTAAAVNPWVSSDLSVATISNAGVVSALTVGTTTITFTNANGCSKDTLFTVTSPSVAGTASGNNTVCSGTNSSIISLVGNTGSIQWQLSTNNVTWVNIGGATSSTYTATNLTVESYYRAVVTNGTCSSVTSNTVTIGINPLPTAFTVTGGGAYCIGDGGVAIGLSGSQSGVQYELFRGVTLFGTANGNGSALNFGLQTQAGSFTVLATNLVTNCQSTMSGSAIVTIKLKPAATISPAGPVNICSPATQTLTATPNITAANASYQWFLDGSPISGATSNTVIASASGVGVYSVVITNTDPANGCVGLKSKAVIVNINASPSNVSVTPSTSEACAGAPITLTVSNDPVEVLNAVSLFEDFNGASTSWVITNGPTSPAATNWAVTNAPLYNNTGSVSFTNFVTQDAGKFILADADAGNATPTVTTITSPVFSLANYTIANITFEHALRSAVSTDNVAQIDISTDGGTNWALLKDYLGQNAGTITNNSQNTANESINLNTFLGQSNLRVRYRYESTQGFYWIIDNVKVSGTRETPVSYSWSPALGLNATSGASVISTTFTATTYTVTANAATCTSSATASITITPNPVITAQPTTPATVCSGNGIVSLSVTATGTNLVYVWRRNGTNLSNNAVVGGQGTSTLTLTNPTNADAGNYDVLVSGSCSVSATSTAVAVTVTEPGTWLGLSTVWTDAANWCGGVPTSTTNVTIPVSANYPVITTQLPVCNNLSLAAGATLTVQGKLAIFGTVTNSGTFIAKDGTIEMAGSSAQTIPALVFQNNNLRNLIIANNSVTLGGNLNLLNKLSFSGSNRTFATAGFLTLKSSDTLTASVGDLTNNNTTSGNLITGNVTTERFVSSRRAWRLLSMPTQHNFQTIKQSWQEGASGNTQNPVPGFGIQITSNRPSWIVDGFDTFSVAGPSVKCYNPVTNLWDGILNTTSTFEAGKAYMTFIRGNRSVTQINQSPSTTILRERGSLFTGTFTIPSVGSTGNQFVSVGNPFASAIDFSKLGRTNVQGLYYLWDPLLGTFGGYQTCLVDVGGNVSNTPGGGSYTAGIFAIQSGQGFFVRTTSGVGSLSFPENAKVDGSVLVTRSVNSSSMIRTNLYQLSNGTPVLYDGVMNRFDDGFVSGVDQDDAEKLGNFNENLGIVRDGKTLAIESRPMPTATDTIQYRLGQVRMTNYRFVLQTQGMAQCGTQAYLEDLFTQTSTPIEMNGETNYDFSISNNPGSYATGRFRLVFRPLAPVPVTYTDVKAEKDEKRVRVTWTVENEVNIARYQIEKSTDGTSFTTMSQQAATSSRAYLGYDEQPVKGNNYYRIKAIGSDGSVIVSRIVRIVYKGTPLITIQPNPVPADGIMQVYMTDMQSGRYKAVLIDATGRQVYRTVINHQGLNQLYRLAPAQKMAQGVYQLILTGPDGQKTTVKVLYESH
ncbi:MAG: beta strand repeat-containing protein [Ferruginibacter sp.]